MNSSTAAGSQGSSEINRQRSKANKDVDWLVDMEHAKRPTNSNASVLKNCYAPRVFLFQAGSRLLRRQSVKPRRGPKGARLFSQTSALGDPLKSANNLTDTYNSPASGSDFTLIDSRAFCHGCANRLVSRTDSHALDLPTIH